MSRRSIILNNNELKHYGIQGMKWGVRRKVGPDGRIIEGTRAHDKQIKKQRRQDSKKRRMLSDKELSEKIARLEKEKKLRELTAKEIDEGKSITNDVLKDAGSKAMKTVLAGAAVYGIKVALTGKFDPKEAAKFVAPLPKK